MQSCPFTVHDSVVCNTHHRELIPSNTSSLNSGIVLQDLSMSTETWTTRVNTAAFATGKWLKLQILPRCDTYGKMKWRCRGTLRCTAWSTRSEIPMHGLPASEFGRGLDDSTRKATLKISGRLEVFSDSIWLCPIGPYIESQSRLLRQKMRIMYFFSVV